MTNDSFELSKVLEHVAEGLVEPEEAEELIRANTAVTQVEGGDPVAIITVSSERTLIELRNWVGVSAGKLEMLYWELQRAHGGERARGLQRLRQEEHTAEIADEAIKQAAINEQAKQPENVNV